jgi:hypothetical protein
MYAEGFAWAMHGVVEDMIAKLCTMLPDVVVGRLPAAREAFAARCSRVWGDVTVGATRTVRTWLTPGRGARVRAWRAMRFAAALMVMRIPLRALRERVLRARKIEL